MWMSAQFVPFTLSARSPQGGSGGRFCCHLSVGIIFTVILIARSQAWTVMPLRKSEVTVTHMHTKRDWLGRQQRRRRRSASRKRRNRPRGRPRMLHEPPRSCAASKLQRKGCVPRRRRSRSRRTVRIGWKQRGRDGKLMARTLLRGGGDWKRPVGVDVISVN